jgi:aldehyde:ferredoxin oxidoreductase
MTLSITNAAGMLPTRNFSKGQFNKGIGTIDKDAVIKAKIGSRACYGCFAGCSNITKVKEGIFKDLILEGPEYETLAMIGANLEIDYLPAIMKANYLCDDLGMDTISAGVAIGFAMECYERGILTKNQTGGLELKFGNYPAVVDLLQLMAHKKGFGAFVAQGVRDMAKELGQNSEDFAMHSKGLEMPAYDPRAGWGSAITYSVTPRGACHRRAWPPSVEILGGVNPFTIEGKAKIVGRLMNARCIIHTLIICDMLGPRMLLGMDDWAKYLNVVVGSSYTGEELNDCTETIETLIRRINIREGFSVEDDILPKRILEESLPDGPGAGKIIGEENFLKMRSEYYFIRGWDHEGIPTQELLSKYEYDTDPKFTI